MRTVQSNVTCYPRQDLRGCPHLLSLERSVIILMPDSFVKHKYLISDQIFAVAILTPGPMVDAATQDLI